MVTTVCKNFEGYTKHNKKKAQEARRSQGMTGSATDREFAGMVREKLITNCPVTVQDIHNANQIFGPDLANLRGNTARSKPNPHDVVHLHKYVMIVADVMSVKGLPFMVTSSQGISLITIKFLSSRTANQKYNASIVNLRQSRI